MKEAIERASTGLVVELVEVNVETDPRLLAGYGEDIPVLFINGSKAFKHRATERELRKRLLKVGSGEPVDDR